MYLGAGHLCMQVHATSEGGPASSTLSALSSEQGPESVHKQPLYICQLINQGRFSSNCSIPIPSWLVPVYLFRVTHSQSCLTQNYQEQPWLHPSINKKMRNEVRRRGSEGRKARKARKGRKGRRGRFLEIVICNS